MTTPILTVVNRGDLIGGQLDRAEPPVRLKVPEIGKLQATNALFHLLEGGF